jgi:2-C-methyl-D-erythritol 4-phosphate cytidylyltransferase
MKLGVVLACAGEGKRLGKRIDKAFVRLRGKPLFLYSLQLFSQIKSILQIALVIRKDSLALASGYVNNKKIILVAGGRHRQQSVYQGVMNLDRRITHVLIHDGARPLLKAKDVHRLKASLKKYDAVTLGIPVKETLKRVRRAYVEKTIQRDNLYVIQTPQGFRRSLLEEAYRTKKRNVSDEARLVEQLGKSVKVIPGDASNIKITYPQDLLLAEALLRGLQP